MSWAKQRRLIYIGGIVIIFLLAVVLPTVVHFYKAPTCFDNKKNGDELGVDCGGACTLLCKEQYAPLNVLWARFAKVNDGVYNVLAYVENPNISAGAGNLDYLFKLYDKNGILLDERMGRTFAPANKVLTVFEPDLKTGHEIPQRVDFSFTSQATWLKQESRESGISIAQTDLIREESSPRLSATLSNKTINLLKKIEAVGIVYDSAGNTLAFSRTILDSLGDHESKVINFNWPKPFSAASARTEIVLKILN
jgi:hypothetical protein